MPVVDPKIDSPSWSHDVDVCASVSASAGCAGGQSCIASVPGASSAAPCIVRAGDLPCPSGPYTQRHVYYASAQDTRDCSVAGCSCGAATGAACKGTVNIHSKPDCSLTIRSFDLDGDCKFANLQPGEGVAVKMSAQGPMGGQCPPAGVGTKIGSVGTSGPTTVCCLSPVAELGE